MLYNGGSCLLKISEMKPRQLSLHHKMKKFTSWWRHQMETFSALLALCERNPRSPVNYPHKCQWRGGLMLSSICAWTNGWATKLDAGNLRRYRAYYDVTVIFSLHNFVAQSLMYLSYFIELFFIYFPIYCRLLFVYTFTEQRINFRQLPAIWMYFVSLLYCTCSKAVLTGGGGGGYTYTTSLFASLSW